MGDYASGEYARMIFRKRRTVRIIVCVALAAASAGAVPLGAPVFVPIGLGVAAAISAVLMLSSDYIFASPLGLEHRALLERQIWRWDEVSGFDLTETRLNVPLVTFNATAHDERRRDYFRDHGVDANVGLSGPWTEDAQSVVTALALAKARWGPAAR